MLTVLIFVVFAAAVLIVILLAVVVVGIRQEPRGAELSNVAPSLVASRSGACSGSTYAGRLPARMEVCGKTNNRPTRDRPPHE